MRELLGMDTSPSEDINGAINRVIADVNNSGRYRFHQTNVNLAALVDGTYSYDTSTRMIAEKAVVFAPGVSGYQKTIDKGSEIIDPFTGGYFITKGDAPTRYWIFGNKILFDPVPNATAALRTITVYGEFDLAMLDGDSDVPGLPARYHYNVLVYGAAAQIRPSAPLKTASGATTVGDAFRNAFQDMVRNELWNPYQTEGWQTDDRFLDMDQWGNVGSVQ